jgi:hypothetical protein
MLFTLTGRDELSDVFDDIGDAARRMGRRVTIATIEADRELRRLGRTTTTTMAGMRRDNEAGAKALGELKKATLLLAPAAIPAAASLAPIAAGAGAVAVALGVMGAAMGPQIAKLGEASEAQKKYQDAVDKSGAASQEAVTAELEYQRIIADMPPKTREAAAAVTALKDDFQDWSDSMSGDTMAPFIKGVAIANSLLPMTRQLVKGTSAEADRFMTIIGGEMAAPGLDGLNEKFTDFATGTLRKVNNELVHLLRVGDGQQMGGSAREFMDWARAQGPTVKAVLEDVGTSLFHVLEAGSDVGVGLLQTIQVLTHLVSAVPPSAIALFLQLALALKLTKAAALGMAAGRTALAAFGAQLVAMQTAAAAAPGRLGAVSAAIGTLSRSAKVAMIGTGIGLLVVGLMALSKVGKTAPPDVDRLNTSLGELARTGKVTGEASRAFGSDLGGLADSLRTLSRPSNLDKTQQFLTSLVGMDSTPVKEAKEDLDAVDKALAGLVQSGHSDLAEAAFDRIAASMRKQGMSTKELKAELGDYKAAQADLRFEQELTAQSQGLFGSQAQKTQAALAAQKQSADGLRQSLQALNDVNRQGLGGMIGFEASLDAAGKAARENAGALSMSHGELNLNSEKARNAATALNDLAAKTDEATASARESGASWGTVSGIYERGRASLIKNAQAMGLTKRQAGQLADQILKIPNKTTLLKGDVKDLDAKIGTAQGKLDRLKQKRKVAVGAEKGDLDRKVAAAQAKVDSLRQKRATALRAIDQASATARAIAAAIARLRNRTVTIKTVHETLNVESTVSRNAKNLAGYAGGGKPRPGEVAWVGENGPELMSFDGTEQIFDHGRSMSMIKPSTEAGRLAGQGLISGMGEATSGVGTAAGRMAAAVEAGIREELQIASPSKRTKALAADIGKGLIVGMTGSRDKIKATAKDLAKDIWAAFSGSKDNRLVAMVNRTTAKLLDAAKKRDSITAAIKRANEFAESSRVGAKKAASLSSMFGGDQEEVTAAGIQQRLAAKLVKMKSFASYIKTLAKRGLNKTMLREILEAGPEEGYAYASALAGANSSVFKAINSTQYKVNSEAEKLGRSGADALYDSGKNASKGFLSGLKSQQKAIESYMLTLAKGMQKALRKALGIRSPARAMMPDGVNVAKGVGVGVLEGLPYVERAMDTMAGRMTGRASLPVAAGRPAIAARGGNTTISIKVDAGIGTDPIALRKELQRLLLQLKRTQGVNVDLGVG